MTQSDDEDEKDSLQVGAMTFSQLSTEPEGGTVAVLSKGLLERKNKRSTKKIPGFRNLVSFKWAYPSLFNFIFVFSNLNNG